jgi:ubiquinone/menaquinone biosynthesis C-methylase UbiE
MPGMASRYEDELWESVPERHHGPGARADWIAALEPARDALDLGCGDGIVSARIPAERLTLADVSAVALSRARAQLPDAEAVELEPDAPLPFDDNVFDLVVCAETLEHVRDVQLLLSEARRVLEPRGRLAVTTPAHRRLMPVPDPLSPHIRFFTKGSLRALLDSMGFDIRTLDRRGGGLFMVASR